MSDKYRHFDHLIAVLMITALLLTGCSASSRTFFFSGSDDPLDLHQIQVMRYEQQQASANHMDEDPESSLITEITESETPLAGPEESTLPPDDSSGLEESDEVLSEEESSQENSLFYDEAYMKKYYAMGAAILDEVGWDLKAAYDWCTEIDYFNPTPDDPALGTRWYADFAFETQRGNCYNYAATFTVMARLLGYEARQVDGHILDFEYLHHSWVEIVVDGETFICDPEFEWQKNMDGFMKKYDDEGIWPLNTELIQYMEDDPAPGSIEAIVERGWPAEGPYTEIVDYLEYLQYVESQQKDSGEEDPNTGCVDDDVPVQ
ncbi:MAG: transglutaminase domain-containing protein [Firmicutes bacterium]|nr:transglutaminase domain-containing protein [Bacillota bacterium]